MKWIIILQTCFLAQFSFGQTYVPFISTADSSDQWFDYRGWGVNGGGSCLEYYRTVYRFNGDTVINGNSYAQLSALEQHSFEPGFFSQNPCSYSSSMSTFFAGGIREVNKQVFFFDALNGSERLLYDFNLGVGDTIPDPSGFGTHVIDSIDSILIGTQYRKQYHLPDLWGNPFSIIEGIGSASGLFQNSFHSISGQQGLYCYAENDISLYPLVGGGCGEGLGIEDQQIRMDIFPNPADDVLTIQSDVGPMMELEIVSSSGQIILSKSLSEETNDVDISRLESGIYFVKVAVDGKVGVQKLVVE